MKEDILEQIADDWLQSRGGLTKANVMYGRGKGNKSDIDIIAIHPNPKELGINGVSIVSCKSWTGGFNCTNWYNWLTKDPNKIISGREAWKKFRELVKKEWSTAFVKEIENQTGSCSFTYYVAVTKTKGDIKKFENILKKGGAKEVKIKIITLNEMLISIYKKIEDEIKEKKHTLQPTVVGRLFQVMIASGFQTPTKELRKPNTTKK